MANLDELGDRMKHDYEDALRLRLPRRTYVVLRIDGKGFHTFTKELPRPYYRPLADAMDAAAMELCSEMTGCRFAFGQSDEYSFLLTDFESKHSRMWFDGNLQKITSVAASVFTGAFAAAFFRGEHVGKTPARAAFDARVMVIPQRSEVEEYFLWRQADAEANSLNMLASAHYSHAELLGKSTSEKHELLHAKGVNWAKMSADFKRGRAIVQAPKKWRVDLEVPVFARNRAYLREHIPARVETANRITAAARGHRASIAGDDEGQVRDGRAR